MFHGLLPRLQGKINGLVCCGWTASFYTWKVHLIFTQQEAIIQYIPVNWETPLDYKYSHRSLPISWLCLKTLRLITGHVTALLIDFYEYHANLASVYSLNHRPLTSWTFQRARPHSIRLLQPNHRSMRTSIVATLVLNTSPSQRPRTVTSTWPPSTDCKLCPHGSGSTDRDM